MTKTKKKAKSKIWYQKSKYHLWLITLLSAGLYLNTLGHEYTLDDAIVIYDNMFTQQGIAGIPGLLANDTFFGFFKEEGKAALVSGGRYRPLSPFMFAIGWSVFGDNPFMFHLMNVFWYVILCLLLYKLINLLIGEKKKQSAGMIAFFATLLFAAHPVHTEVVANIKGRDEIMALLGSLGALYFLLLHHDDKKPLYLIAAAGLFFVGLMSKENAITFLALAPLALYFFRKASMVTALKKSLVLFVVAILFLLIRGSVIGWSMGDAPMELLNNPFVKIEGSSYVPFSSGEWVATISHTLGKYIQLLHFPHPLTHDYYPRHIEIMSFGDWQVWMSIAMYVLLLYLAVQFWRRQPILSYGIIFYLVSLSIVSNIVFPIGTNMSERFLFMPSVGWSLILGYLIHYLSKKKHINYAMGVTAVIVILFSIKTISRNSVWKDNYTLFTQDVQTSKRSAKLLNAVGAELVNKAGKLENEDEKQALINEALPYLEQAKQIHPNYKSVFLQLGNAYNYLGKYDQSIQQYKSALQLDGDFRDGLMNLGKTYRAAGRYDEAAITFGQLRDDPLAAGLQENLAAVYEDAGKAAGSKGQHIEAIEYFKKGIATAVDNAKFSFFIGIAHAQQSDYQRALDWLLKADSYETSTENKRYILNALSDIYQKLGNEQKSAEYLQLSQQLGNQ